MISSIYAVCFLTETGGFFCCQKFFKNFFGKAAILGVQNEAICAMSEGVNS